jgi:hypothetical protein
MSCEVLCCEVGTMIDLLVEAKDGALMDQLFSVVTASTPATHRLAGYFEKVLNVIFRRKSVSVMQYIDKKAMPLFRDFCRQLHNYSIMQSLRTLLLPAVQLHREDPAIGFFVDEACESTSASALECTWHTDPSVLDMLIEQLLNASDGDVRAHTSELLISIIDLSGADSLYHRSMTSAATIGRLYEAALPANDAELPKSKDDGGSDAVITAALSVLEVVVVQFCDEHRLMAQTLAAVVAEETGEAAKGEDEEGIGDGGAGSTLAELPAETITVLCATVPRICAYLHRHEDSESTVASQLGKAIPRLGHNRLKVVNLLEALLRLQHRDVDKVVVENGALDLVLDLFFKHEWNSMLHQSVMAICMMILESKEDHRAELQRHLVLEARLLQRIMAVFPDDEVRAHFFYFLL